jgi:hypothetical protein
MKYTDVKGTLENIICAETDAKGRRIKGYVAITDKNNENHCCVFDYNVPAEYIRLEVWYRQWESGLFSKKVRRELAVYTEKGMNVIALQYKETNKYLFPVQK